MVCIVMRCICGLDSLPTKHEISGVKGERKVFCMGIGKIFRFLKCLIIILSYCMVYRDSVIPL